MDSLRSLALDLVQINVNALPALVRLIADHAIAPARRVWALPAPRPGETPPEVVMQPVRRGYGPGWTGPVPELVTSTALFDPLVVGFVLFERLFPGALRGDDGDETLLGAPEWIYFEESRNLAVVRWEDLERLVDGAFGDLAEGLANDDLERLPRPVENRRGLGELVEAQALVRRVLDAPRPAEPPLLNRRLIGLRQVDESAASALDAVLRTDVHQRAIWFARVDLLFPLSVSITDPDGRIRLAPADDEPPLEQVDDHGVYPTQVPETIRGAVALDLVRTFSRERSVGTCAHCRQPVVLTPHQVGRVDRGLDVFHPDCTPAHRRRWMRDYQRRRRSGVVVP